MSRRVSFPRVVLCHKCWSNAPEAPVFASAHLAVQAVTEAFGPADRYRQTERWAFVDYNGNATLAIVAHAGNAKPGKAVRMDFVGDRAFFDWATERINATANGDVAPAFLLAAH
ncbi:MAG: hypothetical protein ACRD8A_15480 [Candidatus Acidiferrales bacterium]